MPEHITPKRIGSRSPPVEGTTDGRSISAAFATLLTLYAPPDASPTRLGHDKLRGVGLRSAVRNRLVHHGLSPYRIAQVKRAAAPLFRHDLTKLGSFYGTNKASPKQRYTPLYERHLGYRRGEALCILEIGIGGYEKGTGGSSLRMWRTYFPKARVYGIDIETRDLREPRIETFCGDQADGEFLRAVVTRIGAPDVVIDDGSHVSSDVIGSFEILFPLVAAGGVYVIEDTDCSYRTEYGGGPPGTDGTTMELVKRLIDDLAWPSVQENHKVDRRPPALHVYPRIAFIEK